MDRLNVERAILGGFVATLVMNDDVRGSDDGDAVDGYGGNAGFDAGQADAAMMGDLRLIEMNYIIPQL